MEDTEVRQSEAWVSRVRSLLTVKGKAEAEIATILRESLDALGESAWLAECERAFGWKRTAAYSHLNPALLKKDRERERSNVRNSECEPTPATPAVQEPADDTLVNGLAEPEPTTEREELYNYSDLIRMHGRPLGRNEDASVDGGESDSVKERAAFLLSDAEELYNYMKVFNPEVRYLLSKDGTFARALRLCIAIGDRARDWKENPPEPPAPKGKKKPEPAVEPEIDSLPGHEFVEGTKPRWSCTCGERFRRTDKLTAVANFHQHLGSLPDDDDHEVEPEPPEQKLLS